MFFYLYCSILFLFIYIGSKACLSPKLRVFFAYFGAHSWGPADYTQHGLAANCTSPNRLAQRSSPCVCMAPCAPGLHVLKPPPLPTCVQSPFFNNEDPRQDPIFCARPPPLATATITFRLATCMARWLTSPLAKTMPGSFCTSSWLQPLDSPLSSPAISTALQLPNHYLVGPVHAGHFTSVAPSTRSSQLLLLALIVEPTAHVPSSHSQGNHWHVPSALINLTFTQLFIKPTCRHLHGRGAAFGL